MERTHFHHLYDLQIKIKNSMTIKTWRNTLGTFIQNFRQLGQKTKKICLGLAQKPMKELDYLDETSAVHPLDTKLTFCQLFSGLPLTRSWN